MNTTRPKVVLDHEMLKRLDDHYGYRLKAENHLEKECFSAPDLDLHPCCILAKLPGDRDCKCGHVPGRMCNIICLIHEFCLAVYAYRLGIGGDDKTKAIVENLKLKYHDLYDKVQEVTKAMESEEEVGSESTRIMSSTELDTKIPPQAELDKIEGDNNTGEENMQVDPKEKKELVPLVAGVVEETPPEPETAPEPKEEEAPIPEPVEDDLLTIKEAAKLYGCTYANISAKITSGVLTVELINGKKRVKTSDVLRARQSRGKRGRPKKK